MWVMENDMSGKIYVVGLGPGEERSLTIRAKEVLDKCDVIAGYKTYVALVKDNYPDKEYFENGMKGEIERCEKCLEFAKAGKEVALICSGDAGIYGMASPMLEIALKNDFTDVEIVPGITAASSGAAVLGAPLGHDFCVISLSDLLTPWELIEKRLRLAAEADLAMAIYNPSSKGRPDYLKKACEILLSVIPGERICGFVQNIGRDGESFEICSLKELAEKEVDMFTTVFIGNSRTKNETGRMITPRGYNA